MKLSATALCAVLGVGGPGVFAAPAPESTHLPFELRERHQVIVLGAIGPFEGLRFLVDTGSNPSMVDRKIARRLALDVQASHTIAFGEKSRTETAVVPSIRLGPVTAEDVRVSIANLSFLHGVDAIIGLDLLSRISFSIDYERRHVVFGPVTQPEPGLRLDVTPPFLTVPVSIAGRSFRLLVDTGSDRIVLFRRRVQDRLPPVSVHGELMLNHLSGSYRLSRVLLRSVEFGAARLDRVEGFISDMPLEGYPRDVDGVLGMRAVATKRATFDFERNRLSIME